MKVKREEREKEGRGGVRACLDVFQKY